MVDVLLGVGLFLLTVAVVGLFAMMGELASRLPDENAVSPPHAIDGANLGAGPKDWPEEVADLVRQEFGVMTVFSTACASCRRITSGATGELRLPPGSAVMISAPSQEDGQRFIEEHPMLRQYRPAVDPGGEWTRQNLGVDISPSVMTFQYGRLSSAHTFTSASGLEELFDIERTRIKEDFHA